MSGAFSALKLTTPMLWTWANSGESRWLFVLAMRSPPRFSTRRASATAVSGSGRWYSIQSMATAPNVSFGNGSARASGEDGRLRRPAQHGGREVDADPRPAPRELFWQAAVAAA